jgi:NAD(P)-dependent dehydrogenase (short-subunit alcohol dehydrogenase family)
VVQNADRFMGKVALVTGAGSGIGRAIACRLAREGAAVAVCDIDGDGARETVRLIAGMNRAGRAFACDVGMHREVTGVARDVLAAFARVDFLVNNAGTGDSNTSYEDIDEALWDRIYAVNVKAAFFLTQALVRDMIRQKIAGRIVNIASTEGKTNRGGTIVYSSSKHALIGLTQGLAMQLAPYDITVNAVCPGLIDTPIWHKGDRALGLDTGSTVQMVVQASIESLQLKIPRAGTPEEVAGAVAFLCSDDAAYMTGQAINVCGGLEYH